VVNILSIDFIDFGNQVLDAAFFQLAVNELDLLRQDTVEHDPPNGGIQDAGFRFSQPVAVLGIPGHHTNLDLGMDFHLGQLVTHIDFIDVSKSPSIALVGAGLHHGHIENAQHHIFDGAMIGSPSAGFEQVLGSQHQAPGFLNGLVRERYVHSHLVAIEVGVEGCTNQRVQLNGRAFDQDRLESLDAQAGAGWGHGLIGPGGP